jgi:hypothetical protein
MKKDIDVYKAIKHLPESLITPEIYEAGIREGKIELLNILPEKYLTDGNINKILDKSEKSYSWEEFSLAVIPVQGRSAKVCEAAVKKSLKNFPEVPENLRSNNMLLQIMQSAEKHIHYLTMAPVAAWDENAVYKGISSIYGSGNNNSYGRYGFSNSTDKKPQMRLIQVFLAYVPENLKTKPFYLGLFCTSMHVKDVDFLTPKKYKDNGYYIEMGKREIAAVPMDKLSYPVIKEALLSDKNHISDFLNREKGIKESMLAIMDDEMADIVIKKSPTNYDGLPEKFHSKDRMILALDNVESSKAKHIYSRFDAEKFDDDICRAIIRKDSYDCPSFARKIWTKDFTGYCLENAKSHYWFKKMPVELQTQEMADTILGACISKIEYVRPQFITYDMAVEAYGVKDSWRGTHTLEEYIPKHFFEDFIMDTGLPKEFFGGECTYPELKEKRNNHTYCRVGDCYLGFFVDRDGRVKYNRLMMTRRTPLQIKPSVVFSRIVGAFHKTWLEKLIADNDPKFVKPVPAKGLKARQINPYLDVRPVDTLDGVKIYGHTLLGETALFTAETDERAYEAGTLEEMKRKLKEIKTEPVLEEAC